VETQEMNMPMQLMRRTATKFDNENLTLTIMSQQRKKPSKTFNRQSTISIKMLASKLLLVLLLLLLLLGEILLYLTNIPRYFKESATKSSTATEPKKETVQSKINQTGTTETRTSITSSRRNFA
jgi:hypothetical protein